MSVKIFVLAILAVLKPQADTADRQIVAFVTYLDPDGNPFTTKDECEATAAAVVAKALASDNGAKIETVDHDCFELDQGSNT